ncbi:MAG TPA: CocE/NonD family hydrolase [Pseudonocardiaceae bacterium]|nr:CocE/NonD family hydrolase [Pseudonocardiaceae bacterium]
MRDGIVLRADVYRPASSRPVPVILMRAQYGKEPRRSSPPATSVRTGLRRTAISWWSRTSGTVRLGGHLLRVHRRPQRRL